MRFQIAFVLGTLLALTSGAHAAQQQSELETLPPSETRQALEDNEFIDSRDAHEDLTAIGFNVYEQRDGLESFSVRTGISEVSSDAAAGVSLTFSW